MEALKLLLAFLQWIAFWIISGGYSMASLQIGICVAAILIFVMGITRLHRGLILWAGVVFFAFALSHGRYGSFVVWNSPSWYPALYSQQRIPTT